MKMLLGRMVSRLLASESESKRGVLANIVLSKCSKALWLRSNDLKVAETSVKAEVGMATNSLKDKSTQSTEVAWKTSRGKERNLQLTKMVKEVA
jgi:hypothetical protein